MIKASAPARLRACAAARLRGCAPARILNVTAPSTSKLNFDDLQGERRFNALSAFGATKLANPQTGRSYRNAKGIRATAYARVEE